MRRLLTDYFYYTRSERNGIIILVTLSFTIMLLSKILSLNFNKEEKYDFSTFEKEILAIKSLQPSENLATNAKNTEGGKTDVNLFKFNPNIASSEDFINLGLSPKVATTIQNYRNKGGRFYKPEDFKKIYGLSAADFERLKTFIEIKNNNLSYNKIDINQPILDTQNVKPQFIKPIPFDPNTASEAVLLSLGIDEKVVKNLLKFREKNGKFYKKEDIKKIYGFSEIDYLRLESYIQISDNQRIEASVLPKDIKKNERTTSTHVIDINTATFDNWLEIRGIGRIFASRILEYREKLGGFASLEQIKEVYGITDSTYQNAIPYLKIATAVYRKISINSTTQSINHPYLTHKQLAAVIRYRVNHGNFNTMEDLKKVGVFTDEILTKLKPYVVFN